MNNHVEKSIIIDSPDFLASNKLNPESAWVVCFGQCAAGRACRGKYRCDACLVQ